MRITTLMAALIALAVGVLIGWAMTAIQQPSLPLHSDLVAYMPQSETVPSRFAPPIDRTSPEFARQIFTDAHTHLAAGNTREAALLLQANHFKGQQEIERLIQLAAIYVVDDPARSWSYLAEAANKDPENSDLQTFKASLEETLQHNQAAQSSYIAAIQHDANNPYRREILADFYLRIGHYPQALEVLQDSLSVPTLDSIWLKAFFWGHVAKPIAYTGNVQDVPPGLYHDLVSYLFTLPAGILWDQQAFGKLADHQTYSNTRQETFWLQLIASLKEGQEERALLLLNSNPFHYGSWAPELEKSLKTLIQYRLAYHNGKKGPLVAVSPLNGKIDNPEQLLLLLANLSDSNPDQLPSAIPYHIQDYLLSKEAFAIPFLSIGWTEAALQLHTLEKFPDSFPVWIAEAMTQALKQNRDPKAALSFALAQKNSPSLSLLAAEIALKAGEEQIAFNTLKTLYTQKNESGRKAALLLGQFLMEHDNPLDAKKALQAQPSLEKEIAAQELLARIALQEKDLRKANEIYLRIENNSSEAKSFLARKAFADKEWTRARKLTEALLKEYPDNPLLSENLKKIIAEEQHSFK